jgi:hypothetical protein
VFLMPTSSDTTAVELFEHPAFNVEFVCLFELGKQWNRALVVMKKVTDSANGDVQPQLAVHKLDGIRLPKQARVLEENCITYLTDHQHENDAQIQVNVWEIIRRNEYHNFLEKFVARGGELNIARDDKAKSQLIHYAAAFNKKFTRFADSHPRDTFKLALETRASATHALKQQYVRECLAILDKQWQLVNVSSQNETQHVFWLIDYTADKKKKHVSESNLAVSVMYFGRQVASGNRQLVSQCKQQPYRGPSSLKNLQ